jgi:hypothetical protein
MPRKSSSLGSTVVACTEAYKICVLCDDKHDCSRMFRCIKCGCTFSIYMLEDTTNEGDPICAPCTERLGCLCRS